MPGRVVLTDREAAAWRKRLQSAPDSPPPTAEEVVAASVARVPPTSHHAGKRADLGGLYVRSAWVA